MPSPASETVTGTSRALRSELRRAREQTDSLFRLIDATTIYERPVAERHRLIFYLGHFEAFDWNLLARRSMNAPAFHPAFDQLFERGIDPDPGHSPQDSRHDWPSLGEVQSYNTRARTWIDAHLEDLDPSVLQMAIEHRHMHAETFAYLLHGLPYEKKNGPAAVQPGSGQTPINPMLEIAAGTATLGNTSDQFGWDNEYRSHRVPVTPFRISTFKISNGEYLEFVREGGPVPHFWSLENNQWYYRGMFSRIPLPLDWPVWVTWQQASAYADWRGLALPGEAQFQRAASLASPDAERDNFDYRRWDPIPVNAAKESGHAPAQMIGNGWEWTRDIFAPFEGFEPHPLYPGYSADFFDGKHYVMKGASPRTARILTRPSFRNWFRPDYPYMYAGFRLVDN